MKCSLLPSAIWWHVEMKLLKNKYTPHSPSGHGFGPELWVWLCMAGEGHGPVAGPPWGIGIPSKNKKRNNKNYMMTTFVRNIFSCIQALKHWEKYNYKRKLHNCNLGLRDLLTNTEMTRSIFTWRSVVGASVDGLLLHGWEAPLALHS